MLWALFAARKTCPSLSYLHDSPVWIHQILHLFLNHPSLADVPLLSRLKVEDQMRNLLVEDSLQHSGSHFRQANVLNVWRCTLPGYHT